MHNNNEFQSVISKSKKNVYGSGLYNYLSTDKAWIEELQLNPQNVTIKPDNGYLIIELDIKQFPDHIKMKPINWHIRVDKTYNIKKNFLSQWHYTMKFSDDSGETKNMHAYYHYGLFQYITVDGVEITDHQTISSINDHCIHAKNTALSLIAILQRAQNKLTNDFINIASDIYKEEAIDKLEENRIDDILEKCQSLHAKLQAIDEKSSTAAIKFLINRANFIRNRRQALSSIQETEKEEGINTELATSSIATKKTSRNSSKPKIDDNIFKNINERINKIKRSLNSKKVKEILEAHEEIPKLELEILKLYKIHPSSTTKLDDTYLEITSFKSLPEIFKDLVLNERFDEAIALFNSGHGDLTVIFYIQFLAKIGNISINEGKQKEYEKLCNHLYEHSEHYRSALSAIVSKIFSYRIKDIDIGESYLLHLATNDMNILFKMFFKQLNSTTLIGQRCGNRTSDLLSSILFREIKNNELVTFLLKQKYPTEHSATHFDTTLNEILEQNNKPFQFDAKLIWNNAKDYNDKEMKQNIILESFRDIVAVPSLFYHACKSFFQPNRDIAVTVEHLVELAEKSSPLYLILGLSALILKSNKTIRMPFKGEEPTFALFKDDEERMELVNTIGSNLGSGATSIATLMLINDPKVYNVFAEIINIFKNKTSAMTVREKIAVHIELSKMIKNEKLVTPSARSYNLLFLLHLACINSASILQQSSQTYNMIKISIINCADHANECKKQYESQRDYNFLCQSIMESDKIPGWAGMNVLLANNLEEFDYWKINAPVTNTTLQYDKFKEQVPKKQTPLKNEEEELSSKNTVKMRGM